METKTLGLNEVTSEQIMGYINELLTEAKRKSDVDDLGLSLKKFGIFDFGSMFRMHSGIREDGVILYKGRPDDDSSTVWNNRLAYICGTSSLSEREHRIYGVGEMNIPKLPENPQKYVTAEAYNSVPEELTSQGIKLFVVNQIKESVNEKFLDDKGLRKLCESLDEVVCL